MIRRRGRGGRSLATAAVALAAAAEPAFRNGGSASSSEGEDNHNAPALGAPRSASAAALVAAAAEAAAAADAARAARRHAAAGHERHAAGGREAGAAGGEEALDAGPLVARDSALPAGELAVLRAGAPSTDAEGEGIARIAAPDRKHVSEQAPSLSQGAAAAAAATAAGDAAGRGAPERKSRYIEKLVRQAAVRKEAAESAMERKLAKERVKEDELFPDKDRFVTPAYKARLAEREALLRGQDDPDTRALAPAKAQLLPTGILGKQLLGAQRAANFSARQGAAAASSRRRTSRFLRDDDDASGRENKAAGQDPEAAGEYHQQADDGRPVPADANVTPPMRGVRRNDEKSIEAYRQRYYARRAAREKAEQSTLRHGVGADTS